MLVYWRVIFFGDGHGRNPRWGSSFRCLTRNFPWRSSHWIPMRRWTRGLLVTDGVMGPPQIRLQYNPSYLPLYPFISAHLKNCWTGEQKSCTKKFLGKSWNLNTHRIHGTGIFTYMKTIKINHSCRWIYHGYFGIGNNLKITTLHFTRNRLYLGFILPPPRMQSLVSSKIINILHFELGYLQFEWLGG